MSYPITRLRRLRRVESLRRLVRETRLSVDQLVMPLFVRPGKQIRSPIAALPGQFHFSIDQLVHECQALQQARIPAVLLFGIPPAKDDKASHAVSPEGIVQQAVRAIKQQVPQLLVITDLCVCAYVPHGHCGIVKKGQGAGGKGRGKKQSTSEVWSLESEVFIDNDATCELLANIAVSHAKAGADLVAPSDMMDGRVGVIRRALDAAGYADIGIMAYAAKFASNFYGPFRDAMDSSPAFGDRTPYQLDPANAEEALREVALDLQEGADIVMVKPALAYLDLIWRVKEQFRCPVAAFNVSGEYAMVKAAAARGWTRERPTWMEMLLAIKRAGADIVITYWAKDAAKLLQEK